MDMTPTRPAATERVLPIVDVGTREAVGPRGRVDLSSPQYTLLLALARFPHRHPLARDEIVALVYGESQRRAAVTYVQAVDGLVLRLNDKLTAVGHGRPIRAVKGYGFRLEIDAAYLVT